jgi:basic membrane protein A and related proteins
MIRQNLVRLLAVSSLALPLISIPSAVATDKSLVCLAYDEGGRGDQSFNDAAALGLQRAEKKAPFTLETVVTDGSGQDREKRLRSLGLKKCKIIIAIGSGYAPTIRLLSSEFPNSQFAILNDASIESADVASIIFSESQSAFLAGLSAALVSKSGKVAMLAIPNQSSSYKVGFKAGVLAAKKKVSPLVRYVEGTGQAETRALITAGADVIFLALPGSNSAVLKAIVSSNQQRTRKGENIVGLIGVAPDQFLSVTPANQKFIYATVVKRVDIVIEDLIEKTLNNDFYTDVLDAEKGIYGFQYGISGSAISLTTYLPALTALSPVINRLALQGSKIKP